MSSGEKVVDVKMTIVNTEITSTIMKFVVKKVVCINLFNLPIRKEILHANTLWRTLSKNTLWWCTFFFLMYGIFIKQGARTCK